MKDDSDVKFFGEIDAAIDRTQSLFKDFSGSITDHILVWIEDVSNKHQGTSLEPVLAVLSGLGFVAGAIAVNSVLPAFPELTVEQVRQAVLGRFERELAKHETKTT